MVPHPNALRRPVLFGLFAWAVLTVVAALVLLAVNACGPPGHKDEAPGESTSERFGPNERPSVSHPPARKEGRHRLIVGGMDHPRHYRARGPPEACSVVS